MRGLLRVALAAMLEAIAAELRPALAPTPAQGTREEPPYTTDGPDSYVENPGQRGDELLHAEARRARWHSEDEIHDRAHGTRKIGF